MEADKSIKKHILGRVQITRECNQKCIFCSAPPAEKELSFEEIKKKLIELKELGTTDIMLTGGEPTLRKDLFEILDFCNSLNFTETTIQTNGSNLDNMEFLKKIKEYANIKFNISFHTSDKEIFSKISQKPENYQRILNSLDYIGKLNIPAYLTIVISKLNYKELKKHIMFINKNFPHITHFSFNFIDPIYKAKENPETIPTFAETERFIHETVDFMKKNNLTFRIEKLPLCYMTGFEEFCSDIRRGVFDESRIMSFLRAKGDVDEDELMVEKDTKFFYAPQCSVCTLNKICPGVNPNYVKVKGCEEVFPIFDNPEKIIEKVKGSKQNLGENFKKKVMEDLKLFKYAIEKKPNKNNVYDTYSYFLMDSAGIKNEEFIYNAWKTLVEKIKQKKAPDLLSFYIHIPFCESNCNYCCYPSTKLQNEKQLEEYLSFLIQKMEKFSPLFKGLKFKTLYIGGGTPSIFSEEQFSILLKELFSRFDFEEYSEKSIELNPSTTTFEKLKILEKYGFNKISIGVQSLSKRVLELNKRGHQTKDMVKKTIEDFKKLDLNYINVDMVLGLKGDTIEDFVYSFEELCKIGPSNICIYPIKTNDEYIAENYGDFKNFTKFYYPLFDGVAKKIAFIGEKYGYRKHYEIDKLSYIAPLVFAKENQLTKRVDYSYTHFNLPPFSNFCLGFYAHSRIVDYMDYLFINENNPNSMFLKDFSTKPDDYVYITYGLSPRFERVKFIVKKFYVDWEVPRKEYKEFYNTDIVEDFSYAIKALQLLDIIKITEEKIIFRKMDEKEIYPYLLFFVGRKNVLKKVKINS